MAGSFGKFKNATRRLFDKFFYDSEDQGEEAYQDSVQYPQQGQPYQAFAPRPEESDPVTFTQQQAYQPQQGYQQPAYQQAYPAQPVQPEAAPGYAGGQILQNYAQQSRQMTPPPVQTQFSAQFQQPQPRNRRSQQREDNVVQFPVEQQPQSTYFKPEQPAAQTQPQPAPETRAPYQDPLRQARPVSSIRVMNIRSIMDCRSAISLLRQGDMVLVTMESVGDTNEMRRFVDTLSGACFSLMSTITKVSRYGTYLLAPVSLSVYCDGVISQMNSAGRSRPRPQPQAQQPAPVQGYDYNYGAQPRQGEYPQQQPQQPAYAYQQPAPVQPEQQQFYARPAQQEARRPVFENQAAGYGYAPDRDDDETGAEAR